MAGSLYVVATPIGNLEDITLRALRVLAEVELIAAEDTRRTAKLLAHHGVRTRTVSFHEHNTRSRMPQLLSRLSRGAKVALVTDAGTPGVSDPGFELIEACINVGIQVDPIPGASAPMVAAIGSGFPVIPLTVYGFPPKVNAARTRWFEEISANPMTQTFFESPHRILMTLVEAQKHLGNRKMAVGRELTKLHQQFIRGTASEILAQLAAPRGELTVVVGPMTKTGVVDLVCSDARIRAEFQAITDGGPRPRGEIIAATAKNLGLRRRDVYAALERTREEG